MKIALTYTGSDEIHDLYVNWLRGDEDITVTEISTANNNLNEISHCDALVLSGGVDIHPELYDQSDRYDHAPEVFNKERDELEMAAFQLALKNNKPILGICRGLQLINCALGGNLQQDLGNDLNEVHKKGEEDKVHRITIQKGTLLHDITNADTGLVNSAHHQSIQELGEGLKVNSHAADGTIEGVEWADPSGKPFLLCVQWHPERMSLVGLESSPLSEGIRNRFLKEISTSKTTKS